MAMGTRYMIQFNDLLGAAWNIALQFDGYTGAPTLLVGAQTPLTIRYEGDEDNIWDPIRQSKATINIFVRKEDNGIFDDLKLLTDRSMYVLINCPSTGYKWVGWMTPDQVERKIAQDGYDLSMTAVDPFSYAKDAYMQKASGEVLEGKLLLIDYIKACMINATATDQDFIYKITNVINYYGSDTSTDNPEADCLQQVGVYASAFVDSNGRPKDGNYVIGGILEGLGMFCFIVNGVYYFRNPIALLQNRVRTNYINGSEKTVIYPDSIKQNVGTKDFESSFLLNNSDRETSDRPMKTTSLSFPYNNTISILPNSQFYGYNPVTGQFTGWEKFTGAYLTSVTREGIGTTDKPYSARIAGVIMDLANASQVATNKFQSTTFRSLERTSIVSLSLKFKYYDYIKEINTWPAGDVNLTNFVYRLQINTPTRWYLGQNGPGQPYYWTQTYIDGFIIQRVQSTGAVQTVSVVTPPMPEAGTITIFFLPLTLNPAIEYENRANKFYDLISALVTLEATTDSTNNTISGENHYQRQVQDYSKSDDTIAAIISDAPNDTISGALYKGVTAQLTKTWLNIYNGTNYALARQIVAMRMFFARMPKQKFDGEIFSNTLTFDKVIQFKNGNTEILPGNYMQMTDEYDVKNCTHNLVAMSLTGSYKENGTGADTYEFFYTYT